MTADAARLVLPHRLARRDHLNGAWWPRTVDFPRELPLLLAAIPPRLRPIHGVTVNRSEWPGAPLVFKALPTQSPTIAWYGLDQPHLAVLHCGSYGRLTLLVLSPSTPDDLARAAMRLAAMPGNTHSTVGVLELAARQTQQGEPVAGRVSGTGA